MDTRIITGEALATLRRLPAGSVHCCVTSPPYLGLRDYGTAKWKGGRAGCDHKQSTARKDGGRVNCAGFHGSARVESDKGTIHYRDACGKCGAVRIDKQLGLEATPEEYVARLVEVFREVKRVLRDDGTLWLVIGDSYAATTKGSGGKANSTLNAKRDEAGIVIGKSIVTYDPVRLDLRAAKLKPKDLVGIPWRVAFALQADGWYLRSDIIWHKPNPMPESVTDRPTKAHEYLFLLAKSQRYYYDADAIKEPSVDAPGVGRGGSLSRFGRTETLVSQNAHRGNKPAVSSGFRNRRTVWTVTTRPFKGAHFATFPPKLIEPCILAGCPVGGVVVDPFCGAGTTLLVAQQHERNSIGIELNRAYVKMARARLDSAQSTQLAAKAAA